MKLQFRLQLWLGLEISQQIPLICTESYEIYAVSGGGVGSRSAHGVKTE